MSVLLIRWRVELLPSTVISMPQILTRFKKRLGILTAEYVARHGQLHILEYLVERKYDQFELRVVGGHVGPLDCLKYLHETGKAELFGRTRAHKNNHAEVTILDNNCTLPPGWRYEGGELHARIRIRIRNRNRNRNRILRVPTAAPL